MHDGEAVDAVLAQPDAVVDAQTAGHAEKIPLHLFGALFHRSRERVVNRHGHNPDEQGGERRRRNELPNRHAGGAGDDQFKLPGEVDEGRHRSEENGEGQDHLGGRRNPHRRHQRDGRRAGLRIVAGAPQHLDENHDEHQAENRKKDRQNRAHKPQRKIARDRRPDHGCGCPPLCFGAPPQAGAVKALLTIARRSHLCAQASRGSSEPPRHIQFASVAFAPRRISA